jgi:ribosomal protein S18 acetylase RimI-like enzyme
VTSPTLRRATADDHDAVARVLARAFDRDPVANYMLRHEGLERAFGTFFRHAVLPHREAWLASADGADGVDGVALWTPPGKWSTSSLRLLAMGPALLAAVGAKRALARALAAQRVQDRHPKKPHWYLFTIGVDPDKQGRGVGSALLRGVLERCDAERSPAYLEASTESNARLYERHGFAVTEEMRMAPDAPPIWLMWREPR